MQQATTFRAETSVFETITEIAESVKSQKVNGINKTLIFLVGDYLPTKRKVQELERTVAELQRFKAQALHVLKLEAQLNESRKVLNSLIS